MLLWPWKISASFEDGHETVVCGFSDEHCMEKIDSLTYRHGSCTWYSGYCDEDYVNGEYIGRENMIYE